MQKIESADKEFWQHKLDKMHTTTQLTIDLKWVNQCNVKNIKNFYIFITNNYILHRKNEIMKKNKNRFLHRNNCTIKIKKALKARLKF